MNTLLTFFGVCTVIVIATLARAARKAPVVEDEDMDFMLWWGVESACLRLWRGIDTGSDVCEHEMRKL